MGTTATRGRQGMHSPPLHVHAEVPSAYLVYLARYLSQGIHLAVEIGLLELDREQVVVKVQVWLEAKTRNAWWKAYRAISL